MHLHFLDPYRPRQSVIHALDPRVKFVFTLAFILTMALLPIGAWPVYVLMLLDEWINYRLTGKG